MLGEEKAGFHGMLLFGRKEIFMSHLPMFMPQHRYQAIWQITFGNELDFEYLQASLKSDNYFTIAPVELFKLPDLKNNKQSFLCDVYEGHFERNPKRLLFRKVKVSIVELIHWHPFLNTDRRLNDLTYILFGSRENHYLAHWISTSPNFDQLLSISSITDEITMGNLIVISGYSDDQPIQITDTNLKGKLLSSVSLHTQTFIKNVELIINSHIYLESNELKNNMIS